MEAVWEVVESGDLLFLAELGLAAACENVFDAVFVRTATFFVASDLESDWEGVGADVLLLGVPRLFAELGLAIAVDEELPSPCNDLLFSDFNATAARDEDDTGCLL